MIKKKELEKCLKETLKELIPLYSYKKRGDSLYKKIDEYFISVLITTSGMNQNLISATVTIKPYFIDEIFWEVFQMSENIKKPIGLRANGAFVFRGLEIYNQEFEVRDYSEVSSLVKKALDESEESIQKVVINVGSNSRDFLEYSKQFKEPGLYKVVLAEMLINIKEKNYEFAKNIAMVELENHRKGKLENLGLDIYEHVICYCNKQLKEV